MGLDLEVLASHFRERGGEILPTARLRLGRDERLFGQLDRQATPPLVRPLPEGLRVGIYEDQGLSPDGTRLAATTDQGVLALWDLRHLRRHLAALDLDWPMPPDPAPAP